MKESEIENFQYDLNHYKNKCEQFLEANEKL